MAAIAWLERAFGFEEDRGEPHRGGRGRHARRARAGGGDDLTSRRPTGYASPVRLRENSELARRAYDNPWVIDGDFVEVDDVRDPLRTRSRRGSDDPPRPRGARDRLPHLHRRGPRGPPLDVRAAAVSNDLVRLKIVSSELEAEMLRGLLDGRRHPLDVPPDRRSRRVVRRLEPGGCPRGTRRRGRPGTGAGAHGREVACSGEPRRVPDEPRPRSVRRGFRAPAGARRRRLPARDPGDGASFSSTHLS